MEILSLSNARFVRTNFSGGDLTACRICGCSAWDVKMRDTIQQGLIITPKGKHTVKVDDLKVAQFIYLVLDNPEIRRVIDTITTKAVLILGRFTKKRKEVLDAIAAKLRTTNLVPIIFDFKKPQDQDIIETVTTLAGISKFVIAKGHPLNVRGSVSVFRHQELYLAAQGKKINLLLNKLERLPFGGSQMFFRPLPTFI